jgi:hypothetical protein
MGHVMFMQGREDFFVNWDIGYGGDDHDDGHGMHHGEAQGGHEDEREIDVGWSHYVNPNLSSILGYRFTDIDGADDRFFAGARYRLPYLIESSLTVDDDGDLRGRLAKSLQLTARGALFGAVEYDTGTYADWSSGASLTLLKQLGLIAEYDSDHGLGVGVTVRL